MMSHFSVGYLVNVSPNVLVFPSISTHKLMLMQLKILQPFLLLLFNLYLMCFLFVFNDHIFNNILIDTHWDHLPRGKY
jgi:hypothetical protein